MEYHKHLAKTMVLLSLFCQSAASIIYQVSWMQANQTMVGSTMPILTMTVCLFLLGTGLGISFFSSLRLNYRSAWRMYCLNLFFLFASGIFFVATHELAFIANVVAPNPAWLTTVYGLRLSVIGIYILLTAVLSGSTFPLLIKICSFYEYKISKTTLYLFNLLGTGGGALLADFILLPNAGVSKTTLLAAFVFLLAALLVFLGERLNKIVTPSGSMQSTPTAPPQIATPTDAQPSSVTHQSITIISIAGFFMTFLQFIFIRFYNLIFTSSSWTYALVLAIDCFSISLASVLVQRNWQFFISKEKQTRILFLLFSLAACFLLFSLLFLPQLPFIFIDLKNFLQALFWPTAGLAALLSTTAVILLTVCLPFFCLGAILPIYFNTDRGLSNCAQMYTNSLFASTVGAFAGGIVFIPLLGVFSKHTIALAIIISAIILFLTGLWLFNQLYSSTKKSMLPAIIIFASIFITILPTVAHKSFWNEATVTAGLSFIPASELKSIKNLVKAVDLPVLYYRESLNNVVSVIANEKLNVSSLKTDGQTEASLPIYTDTAAPTSDAPTQILLGLLPTIFCHTNPAKIFLLGYGSGLTARSILNNDQVKNLTTAEIEPAIIEADQYFSQYLDDICPSDKRLNITIMDGRSFLSMLKNKWDIIISQPGEPSRNSSAHLYTLEFWQLAKSRLQQGGAFCQWLPLYAIDQKDLISLCNTFYTVFPNTNIIKLNHSGDLILLGFNDDKKTINIHITAANRSTLTHLGLPNTYLLLNTIRLKSQLLPSWLEKYTAGPKDNYLNQDDFPLVQYRLQYLCSDRGNSIDSNVENIIP